MTLRPTEYDFFYKGYPMFTQWALPKGTLFLPKEYSEEDEDKQYDLTSKIYVLMKRLGQDYNTIQNMDANERDLLFGMEMKLIKEEAKQNEKK